jgi:HEAT repeat protein
MVALEYIGEAIARGNKSDEIRSTLEFLSLEGVWNKTFENGRLMNNFPDVRLRAATYLGQIGTPEAKDALKKMVMVDNEPMVLTEAIKSLAAIGLNDNNDVTSTISVVVSRFDMLKPDNLLALSAVEAYEKIAAANGGLKDPTAITTLMRIAEGNYIRPVQERARQVLMDLRRYSISNQ